MRKLVELGRGALLLLFAFEPADGIGVARLVSYADGFCIGRLRARPSVGHLARVLRHCDGPTQTD
jgi:hypothetical protein